ncbi:MAG: HesA/MoeB/ThiF family protein [Polyangiaceae bacterium]|nr:HesA/MoeB/ThiF family protein [Polyangiaceae bacterium]
MRLTATELARYRRQIRIDGWGEAAQARLKASTVFIAGAGGLGSPVAMYLAVAGVGQLRIADADTPEMSNLNRQILHDLSRIGMNKAESAKLTLDRLNPEVRVVALAQQITEENTGHLVGDAQIIVDCLDNFPTRFVLNRTALRRRIPLVHGAVWGVDGRLAFIHAPDTPCLRCIVPEPPPSEQVPVLGATAGIIGSLQALATIQFLAGLARAPEGELVVWDGSAMSLSRYGVRKDPRCADCGEVQ